MSVDTVKITREKDLCVSCGICAAACPKNAIKMTYAKGQFLPDINEKCNGCGICLEICPGIDIPPKGCAEKDPVFIKKNCLECYTAYSNNVKIRENSTSGGMITSLVANLLKTQQYDYVFVLPFNKFDGREAELTASNNPDEVIKASGSKYIPVSVSNVIEALKKQDNKKYIVIATGCEIYGIKKYLKRFSISENNILFLGLFCEKTMSFNMLQYFEDTYKKNNEKISEFYFRTKENGGWPGNTKIIFDSGRQVFVDRMVRMRLKKYFHLNRCFYCADKLNYYSDIAFGDCYIKGRGDYLGKSTVIIRTQKGLQIFNSQSNLFTLDKESIENIISSQNIKAKRSKGKIKLGQNYEVDKIHFYVKMSFLRDKVIVFVNRIFKLIFNIGIFLYFYIYTYFFRYFFINHTGEKEKDCIIIVGGELYNKGAQAMTFTAVDQIKRRFPNKKIYLFSNSDYQRTEAEKSIYSFFILPWNRLLKLKLLTFPSIFIKKIDKEINASDIIGKALFVVDVSGYALSSQWTFSAAIDCLYNFAVADRFFVPYYILPQSMGPFEYNSIKKFFLFPLLRFWMKYPKKIFIREKNGLSCVSKFTNKNISHSHDIVFFNKEYNLYNIYSGRMDLKHILIEPNSVGIIPNQRIRERIRSDALLSVYEKIIKKLRDAGKNVYIFRHSYEDLSICHDIKDLFNNDEKVHLIEDDLNAIELENLIKQFIFVVASRYHSVVHAYKNGIPALIIGWADKYHEIANIFGQLQYFFDCRNNIDNTIAMLSKLDKMILGWDEEKSRIVNSINNFQSDNIFDILGNSTNGYT